MNVKISKTAVFYVVSIPLLLILMIYSYTVGVANISIGDALAVAFSKLPFVGGNFDISHISNAHLTILTNLRLPRVLLAAVSGMSLAVVGAVFQGLFQNPLAEPYVLGISSGASLGATIAIVLGLNTFFGFFSIVSLYASAAAILTVLFVMVIAGVRGDRMSTVLLTGISIGFFASSVSTVLMVLNQDKIKTVTMWSMGSFTSATWDKVAATVPLSIVGLCVICVFLRELNAISIGEDSAKSFGISVYAVRRILIITGSAMVALTVAAAGIVGFVGLIVPNALRRIFGANFRKIIPASAVTGAIFLLVCDTLARVLFAPSEIPAGSITAFFGTPFFIFLALRRRGQG